MEMTKDELNKIIERHSKWVLGVDGGILADLREANLSEANLIGANLSGANLSGADLSRANLSWAALREANLSGADLRWANLSEADLSSTDLRDADLRGVNLTKYMYQITGCGSVKRTTTYDVLNNQVICGCWVCNDGNTLENFEKRIEDVYGENGKTPNKKYYQEYMGAIEFFKAMKKSKE